MPGGKEAAKNRPVSRLVCSLIIPNDHICILLQTFWSRLRQLNREIVEGGPGVVAALAGLVSSPDGQPDLPRAELVVCDVRRTNPFTSRTMNESVQLIFINW